MASLDSAPTAQTASTPISGFRATGEVSNYKSGMTKPKKAGATPQPFVSIRLKGTTVGGKPLDRTVIAFGQKAIDNLDVTPTTKMAGVFVKFDQRSGRRTGLLVPVGPYRA